VHLIDRLEVEEKACVSPLFSGKLVQLIEYKQPAGREKDNNHTKASGGSDRAKRSRTTALATTAAREGEEKDGECKEEETIVSSTEMPFCGPWTIDIPLEYRVGNDMIK